MQLAKLYFVACMAVNNINMQSIQIFHKNIKNKQGYNIQGRMFAAFDISGDINPPPPPVIIHIAYRVFIFL